MRCKACNRLLSDFESTRKSAENDEFIDLCNECYITVADDVAVTEREDLKHLHDEIVLDNFD